MPDYLTTADLVQFERELRRRDASIFKYLRPGCSEPEAEERATAAHLRLPQEVLTWFSWQGGVDVAAWPPENMLGPFELLSLDEAIEGYRWRREQAVSLGPEFEENVWSRRWLPIAVQLTSRTLAVDISGPVEAPAPVYLVDAEDFEESREPKCASMKAMIELWTDALTNGLWRWDDAERQWDVADDGSAVRGGAIAVVFG
jgi:hypothetical protein